MLFTCRLAAQADVLGVIIGSIVGHAACTGAAVLGGKHLAEHIDEKIVGVGGGLDSSPLHDPCGPPSPASAQSGSHTCVALAQGWKPAAGSPGTWAAALGQSAAELLLSNPC